MLASPVRGRSSGSPQCQKSPCTLPKFLDVNRSVENTGINDLSLPVLGIIEIFLDIKKHRHLIVKNQIQSYFFTFFFFPNLLTY